MGEFQENTVCLGGHHDIICGGSKNNVDFILETVVNLVYLIRSKYYYLLFCALIYRLIHHPNPSPNHSTITDDFNNPFISFRHNVSLLRIYQLQSSITFRKINVQYLAPGCDSYILSGWYLAALEFPDFDERRESESEDKLFSFVFGADDS